MNFKISFTTMATPELDIPAQAAVARAYGFDGVDLRVIERGKGEIPADLTREQADQVLADFAGIEIPCLMCYNKKIQDGHEQMVGSILHCIRNAEMLKAPMIRIFTGRIETPEDMDALVAALQAVLERDTSSVKIAMQNHVNNISLAQALEACERVDDPRVGIIVSPDQSVARDEDYMPLLPRVAKYAFELYVADKSPEKNFVLIGTGIIDNGQILKVLQAHGFRGYVTLKWEKVWIPELPEYPEGMDSFLSWLRRDCGWEKAKKSN